MSAGWFGWKTCTKCLCQKDSSIIWMLPFQNSLCTDICSVVSILYLESCMKQYFLFYYYYYLNLSTFWNFSQILYPNTFSEPVIHRAGSGFHNVGNLFGTSHSYCNRMDLKERQNHCPSLLCLGTNKSASYSWNPSQRIKKTRSSELESLLRHWYCKFQMQKYSETYQHILLVMSSTTALATNFTMRINRLSVHQLPTKLENK